MESYEKYWQAENPESRERFTKPPKGQTEQLNFRIYTFHARMLDEIIHSTLDPSLKTKSDCLQDAVALWIEDWEKKHSDGLSGRTLRRFHMERMLQVAQERDNFMEEVKQIVDLSKKTGDRNTLFAMVDQVEAEVESESGHAPKTYLDDLRKIVKDINDYLED